MASPDDEERLARELAEELKRLRVEDVVIQTLVTVSAIGYRGLGLTPETKDARDLAQARLAIDDDARAHARCSRRSCRRSCVRDFNSSVANLQLAYAGVASEETAGGEPPAGEPGEEPQEAETECRGGAG